MTDLAVIFRNGIASGNRVAMHIIVKIYCEPDLVLEGDQRNLQERLNGSPTAGIGRRVALPDWASLLLGMYGTFYSIEKCQLSAQAKKKFVAPDCNLYLCHYKINTLYG